MAQAARWEESSEDVTVCWAVKILTRAAAKSQHHPTGRGVEEDSQQHPGPWGRLHGRREKHEKKSLGVEEELS